MHRAAIDVDEELRALEPMLRAIAARYTIHGNDHDDNLQVCRIAAWEAIRRYDPATRVPLRNWCAIVADRRLKDAMTHANRGKRGGPDPGRTFALHGPIPGGDGVTFAESLPAGSDTAGDVEARDELASLLAYLRARSRVMRTAGLLFLIGCTYEEIGQVTGGDKRQVDNAIQRIRRAVRANA